MSFSLHPFNLAQLFSPYVFSQRIYAPASNEWFVHEFGVYNGAISTLCLFWIPMRWKALAHRRLAAGLLCLAALAVVLSLGRYGGIYPVLAKLPGLSGLRASDSPHRAAALRPCRARRRSRSKMRSRWRRVSEPSPCSRLWLLAIPIAVGVTIEIAAGVMSGSPLANGLDLRLRSVTPALAGIAAAVGSAALLAACAMRMRWAAPLLIVFTATDLAAWGIRYAYSTPPSENFSDSPGDGLPSRPERRSRASTADAHRQEQAIRCTDSVRRRRTLGLVRSSVRSTADSAAVQRIAGVQWDWTSVGWVRRDDALSRARLVAETAREHRPGDRSARQSMPRSRRWSMLQCRIFRAHQGRPRSFAMTLAASDSNRLARARSC